MIMSTKALLLRSPHPSEAELLEALRYNLCRCGAHIEIMRAAMRAAVLSPRRKIDGARPADNRDLRPGSLSVVRPAASGGKAHSKLS